MATSTGTIAVPLAALGRFSYGLEYAVVWERDRQPTINVQADVKPGAQGIEVTNRIDRRLASLRRSLPPGYRIEIGGTVEINAKAQASINAQMPLLGIAVLVIREVLDAAGLIAMFGIIMRNSVILVDQIDKDVRAGHGGFEAVVGATVRRFRPITLTAAAAVLGLIPLVRSNFFGPMATALMGGITVATVLTLFFLPALYALWFRIDAEMTR